ncbi:MAG: lysylphosphatidylglycerol synthase transmembrane domain-containing protein [Burkholderiales bacterium]
MKHLGTLLKLAATVALFWFVFTKVDVAELASKLSPGQIAVALAAGVLVLSIQTVIAAMRLRYCVRLLGRSMKMRDAWIACQYGGFFSHTPISFLGGDAMRVWHMVRIGLPLAHSAKAVLVDRALGFFGMMALVLLSAPALYAAITDPRMWGGYLVLLGIGITATLVFFMLGRLGPIAGHRPKTLRRIAEFASISKYLTAHPQKALKAFVLGLAVTSMNVLAIWAIGLGYGNGIGFLTTFAAAPVVFLISMVPISVAGWGLREGAFVVAFALFGVSPEAALTVSVSFGAAVLLAYLPGAALFLARRRSGAPDAAAPPITRPSGPSAS